MNKQCIMGSYICIYMLLSASNIFHKWVAATCREKATIMPNMRLVWRGTTYISIIIYFLCSLILFIIIIIIITVIAICYCYCSSAQPSLLWNNEPKSLSWNLKGPLLILIIMPSKPCTYIYIYRLYICSIMCEVGWLRWNLEYNLYYFNS